MEIVGKVAVVTGGGSGIGRATAIALAKEGADVVVAARNEASLTPVCEEIRALGRQAVAVGTDVSKLADVRNLFDRSVEAMGRVDILMNNAGVHMMGPIENTSIDDWQWMISINLWGVIHGVNVFLPHMLERGSGHIVNTASIAGQVGGLDGALPYTTTKFAVVGFSEGLAVHLRPKGIGVSVLCPGLVQTDIVSRQRTIPTGDTVVDTARSALLEVVKKGNWSLLQGQVVQADFVAGLVVDAIKNNRFLILTHDDSREMILRRAKDPEGLIDELSQRSEQSAENFKTIVAAMMKTE